MLDNLIIEGARQNNLKNISLVIPHNQVTVVTGLSGSGKSSLAFDTIFAEGQWRYIESLSAYARMFLEKVSRPELDAIRNVRPAVALEQRNPVKTSRSTVGTVTEAADYLRILYAKIGRIFCPRCGSEVKQFNSLSVGDEILRLYRDQRLQVLFPVAVPKGELHNVLTDLTRRGFGRVKTEAGLTDADAVSELPQEPSEIFVILDRIVVRPGVRSRLAESLETAFLEGTGEAVIETEGQVRRYSLALRCMNCGISFERPRPLLFSFNHPIGACPECKGFGNVLRYDENLILPDLSLSLEEGAIEPWTKPAYRWWMEQMLEGAPKEKIDTARPFHDLSKRARSLVFKGSDAFYGVNDFFEHLEKKRYKLHVRVFLSRYRRAVTCSACGGTRLKPEALQVKIAGVNVAALSAMPVEQLNEWFRNLALSDFERRMSRELVRRIVLKLAFLQSVGLGYLTLDRQTRTLSGGEAQRVNLANQLASKLTGTLYVLDEPSIGLHSRDTVRLAQIVRELAEMGNTVIIVEHDRTLIEAGDHVVEMGPAAGERGGRVVFAGPMAPFRESSCLTARYLRGEERIPVPKRRRRQEKRFLVISGAAEHNLKDIDVKIPLHTMTCITGVSGSGKSTLVQDTLYRALARSFKMSSDTPGKYRDIFGIEHVKGVRLIDQEPIGKTPRSNPVTYVKAFDLIRKFYAELPEAKMKGLTPGHFSFNVAGGRCEMCRGSGVRKIEMYVFGDFFVTCDECRGKRYRPEVLAVSYKGRNIHQVLEMTVTEALAFFHQDSLLERLRSLADVGLGYLRLGQPATTHSGGESQRLKISRELGGRGVRDFIYILDEPTTGLHFEDIKKLLEVLNALIDAGNTVVVVEHNLDVIKTADWIIDLGPGGGEDGGRIVADGTPEVVARVKESWTGKYLKGYLRDRP
ncbi:MAG TPA: excinuclease ABC subunit UvrA [Nitrospirota bacterium]|nr:excinuclease ABC subunit UvrA [Nitrospirota bacterium]